MRRKEVNNQLILAGRLNMKGIDQIKRVYDPAGLAPTLTAMQGGNLQPKIVISVVHKGKEETDERTRTDTTPERFNGNRKNN